jgi:MIP family channel proteins
MGRALVAEFIGTFALIFVGVLAICSGGDITAVALAHGITIAVMASATAAISGGHVNPAVTTAMITTGRIKLGAGLAYIVFQLLGGVAGAYAASYAVGPKALAAAGHGLPALANGVDVSRGIFVEAILTFFLVFTIFGTAVDKRAPKVGGLYIGLAITLDIFAGGPITGAAMNVARWFGPAVYAGDFKDAIVYIVGPLLGAGLAGIVYSSMLEDRDILPVDSEVRTNP